jgi:hypothetical protein
MTTCVTPAGKVDCDPRSKNDKCAAGLEEQNARLNEHVVELNRCRVELVVTIEELSAEIKQLRVHHINERTIDEEFNNVEDKGQGMRHEASFEKTRKHRIQVENTKFSSELSILINDFVTSSCFADRQKFPSTRLAKIVIGSILSFEWTYSEVANLSLNSSKSSNALSTLSALLTIKRCHGNKNKAATLVDGMWDDDFLDEEAQQNMIERARTYF